MDIQKLTAARRTEAGKGPSRRLRREGKIPAIAYGRKLEPLALAVSPKDLKVALSGVHGRNVVMELNVEGGSAFTAMVRQYAHHPVTREILHADFIQIALNEAVDVEVPFKLFGKCKGVTEGGLLAQIYRTLPVRCLPEKIPNLIELDVTDLGLGESYKVNQLVLAEGVSVRLPAEQTIAVVNAPDKKGEAEDAAEAAAKATAAAGKAAAPAAAAAGKAAPAAKPAAKK